MQNLEQLLNSDEVLYCLAGSNRQTLMESGLSSRLGRDLAAARETIEELKRREADLGDEISAVYGAYDKTMAELRRCREGVRDFGIKVMMLMLEPKVFSVSTNTWGAFEIMSYRILLDCISWLIFGTP